MNNFLLGAGVAIHNAQRNRRNNLGGKNTNSFKYGLSKEEIDEIIKEGTVFEKKILLFILVFIGCVILIYLSC